MNSALVTCASLADGHRQVVKGPEGFFWDSVRLQAGALDSELPLPLLRTGRDRTLRGAEEANASTSVQGMDARAG